VAMIPLRKTSNLVSSAEKVSFGVGDPHKKTPMEVVENARMHASVNSAHLIRMKAWLMISLSSCQGVKIPTSTIPVFLFITMYE
jgi:hypothetical protein